MLPTVNSKRRSALASVFADPPDSGIAGARIESLLVAAGCRTIEDPGSSVTFEKDGKRVHFHRPHPRKRALPGQGGTQSSSRFQ